jgi:phosphoribosylamine--glycine ligase
VTLIEHALDGTLDRAEAEWDPRVALGVVLAAAGYPDMPRKGDVIEKLPESGEDYRVFHAGTAREGGRTVVNGGRVLCVTALGHNVRTAQKRAYDIVGSIHFEGMQYRRDIGHRAIPARGAKRAPETQNAPRAGADDVKASGAPPATGK